MCIRDRSTTLKVVPAFISIITSMFLHGGWMHLIGNMTYLYIFGDNIEENLGKIKFIIFYLLTGGFAALSQALLDTNSITPMIGASGAIARVIGAYLVTFGSTLEFEWNDKTIIASLLALLSAFCWGSSTVLGKHALKSLPFEAVTSLRLTITAFFTLIVLFATAEFSMVLELKSVQWQKILMIVFSSGSIALAIYYYGLQSLPASHTTIYELAWPLSALLLDPILRLK